MTAILVVDDSPTMRKMVRASLQSLPLEIGEATNGLEAIEQLSLRHFDLMILDLNMPDMHGLEVITHARSYDAYKELPILVLTTRNEEEVRAAVMAAGASRYQTKPFQPAGLLQNVRELLDAKLTG